MRWCCSIEMMVCVCVCVGGDNPPPLPLEKELWICSVPHFSPAGAGNKNMPCLGCGGYSRSSSVPPR